MDYNQKRRFQNLFKINPSSIDNDGILLFKVIGLDSNRCDEETELTYEDFYDNLYVENIKSIEESLERLKKNLLKGEKYHYIHSYGKNGKTTFNKRFIHENRDSYRCIIVDFKDFQINTSGQRHSIITKSIKFYNLLGSLFGDKFIQTILDCLIHIQNTQLELKIDSSNNELRDEYNSLFSSISSDFISFIEQIRNEAATASPDIKNPEQKIFKQKFETFIDNLLSQGKIITIDLFNLLLLTTLRLYNIPDKKLIFIFDNIDDILTHASEYLTAEILPQVDIFFTILNKYLNLKDEFINEKVLDETSFIFTYRTANYVSSIYNVNYNLSASARKESLLSAPIYVISSVNATIEILKRKLEFYETICNSFNIDKAPSYDILKSILESIDNDDQEFKYLFKLWNGNQFAFIECFKSLALSEFKHSILKSNNITINIKRGAFLYFIVNYYIDDENKRIVRDSTLSAAFQYAFTNDNCSEDECACNLLRMFLTYIVSHNSQLNRNKIYADNKDIFSKGVSFKQVLDDLTQFKRNGKIVYDKEMFKELFDRIFYDDIDAFDYFITCAKNTELKKGGKTLFGKKYDFSEELNIYFDNPELSHQQKTHLNDIRLYYNTNARYFLNDVKKHFEFFSSTIRENNHPLSYRIKIFHTKHESDLFNDMEYTFIYNFNNNEILRNVFERVRQTVKTVTEFYTQVVIYTHPPIKYCKESYFALDGVFHFDDLISKHITYIEKIRQSILNRKLDFEVQHNMNATFVGADVEIEEKILADLNGRFIYWIEKYIVLFNITYEEIKEKALELDKGMDSHSYATRKSFRILLNKIKKIKESNFTDFTTKIETSNEKFK